MHDDTLVRGRRVSESWGSPVAKSSEYFCVDYSSVIVAIIIIIVTSPIKLYIIYSGPLETYHARVKTGGWPPVRGCCPGRTACPRGKWPARTGRERRRAGPYRQAAAAQAAQGALQDGVVAGNVLAHVDTAVLLEVPAVPRQQAQCVLGGERGNFAGKK